MPNEPHPDLLALAEKAWRGELDLQFEHHPVHRHYPGSCRIAEDLLGFKGTLNHAALASDRGRRDLASGE